jgi:hypothetical protein
MKNPLRRGPVEGLLARHDAIEADIKRRDGQSPAPVRLEVGTAITALTDAGQAVGGQVTRVWQTFADSQAGSFRVLCAPAGDDSDEEGQAS